MNRLPRGRLVSRAVERAIERARARSRSSLDGRPSARDGVDRHPANANT